MLTLYYKPYCQFCTKVLSVADSLGITFTLKDITVEESIATELVMQGGRRQVPFLVDAESGMKLYESDTIVAYIKEKAGRSSVGMVRVHKSENSNRVC